MVPWVRLQCVIVVFHDHAHLLFNFAGFTTKASMSYNINTLDLRQIAAFSEFRQKSLYRQHITKYIA